MKHETSYDDKCGHQMDCDCYGRVHDGPPNPQGEGGGMKALIRIVRDGVPVDEIWYVTGGREAAILAHKLRGVLSNFWRYKMGTYYMTSYRANERGCWELCKAATLTGAKREATRAYGAGYIDAVLKIAVGDNITEPRLIIAEKSNFPGGKWKTV